MCVTEMTQITNRQWKNLVSVFGERLQKDVPLARFTSARLGGPADVLLVAHSVEELEEIVQKLWEFEVPFLILGGGSNVLISDRGIREVVVLNQAKEIHIRDQSLTVWAGSGASFGQMARKVSSRGYTGLEWATGIPGSVGGAVYGNAGAHGGDVAGNLLMAEILHPYAGREDWSADQMAFSYRSSVLKREAEKAVILSASFSFYKDEMEISRTLLAEFTARRKRTQPPGASMGSMFRNPPGDYAGRLIDQAGLKGTRIGGAEISPVHANFFINHPGAMAADVSTLIHLAQNAVMDQFGIELILEIELIGEWESKDV